MYVDVGDTSSYNTGVLTASAWVYPLTWASTKPVMARDDLRTLRDWGLGWGSGTGMFRFYGFVGGVQKNAQSAVVTTFNKWHHIVGVADGTNIYLYIDGKLDTQTAAGALDTNSYNVHIGNRGIAGDEVSFNGYIDDVRIYNRALTAGEVRQLYTAGR